MNPTIPSKLSIIFAGEDILAELLTKDGEQVGEKVHVRVRAMPARHLGRVLQLADKEAELLDFVCQIVCLISADGEITGRVYQAAEPGWADNLTDKSHTALYEAAKRLNFSRAATWAERQIAAKQFTGELALKAEEALTPMLERIVGLLGSLSKPPSTAAAPSTRS